MFKSFDKLTWRTAYVYDKTRKKLQRTKKHHLDPSEKVINLSTKFTFYELKLLNKNLNFCPTPNRYNNKQF